MSGLRLDHLAFPCSDAAATLRFHVEVLGSTLTWASRTNGRLAFVLEARGGPTLAFTCGDGIHPLPAVRPCGDAAHVGLAVADAGERDRWKRRLGDRGVFFTVEDEGADERVYFADPNGVVFEIEIASPPPRAPNALEIVHTFIDERTNRPRVAAVAETFFSVGVTDMQRATAFYAAALGATVSFPSAAWSSLHIAGVRLGLALDLQHTGGRSCLHFAVDDLPGACAQIERAGGRVTTPSIAVAPGVVIADVIDTENNAFALTQR